MERQGRIRIGFELKGLSAVVVSEDKKRSILPTFIENNTYGRTAST